jgi:hypothetical protein
MASAYPGALDNFATDKTDSKSTGTPALDHAGHHNDLADAVNKIEAELGINPSATFADVVARLAARQTCRKSADQTFTTQTPANVTDMSFAVAASQDYYFKFIVGYTCGAGRGVEWAITNPASPTFLVAAVHIFGQITTAGSTDAAVTGLITASGGVVSHTPTAGATTSMSIIEGILSNGANAGTLQLQASEGNGTTDVSVVVKKGSYGELYLN